MVLINATKNGIGDVSLECWYPEVEFFCLPVFRAFDVIKLFGGKIIPYTQQAVDDCVKDKTLNVPPEAITITDILPAEYADRLPRIKSRAALLGLKAEPKRPKAFIPKAATDWAREQIPQGEKMIVLAPQASFPPRAWLLHYWIELAEQLEAMGYFVVATWADNVPILHNAFHRFIQGATIYQTAALLQRAALLISLDSGLAHVCGNLNNIPVLALTGPTDALAFWHLPSVETMTHRLDCAGCWFQPGFYRRACVFGCAALARITPEQVIDKAKGMLR